MFHLSNKHQAIANLRRKKKRELQYASYDYSSGQIYWAFKK